jgi:hypothetical protein
MKGISKPYFLRYLRNKYVSLVVIPARLVELTKGFKLPPHLSHRQHNYHLDLAGRWWQRNLQGLKKSIGNTNR